MINFKSITNETLSLFFFGQKVRTKVKSSNYMSRGRRAREEDKGAEGRDWEGPPKDGEEELELSNHARSLFYLRYAEQS